jgi:hypothetical protein
MRGSMNAISRTHVRQTTAADGHPPVPDGCCATLNSNTLE